MKNCYYNGILRVLRIIFIISLIIPLYQATAYPINKASEGSIDKTSRDPNQASAYSTDKVSRDPNQASRDPITKEMMILDLYYEKKDLVVTPTRHPKGILQVAENITVITSEELEMINAHTLTDALNNISGVQIDILSGPGSVTIGHIQGSELRQVPVMLDGIAMNNLANNIADIGSIPIQNIERIEIIKGPASSSWGSSLGGIINIITKSPSDSNKTTGTYSAFYGEKNSTDYRAEASATVKGIGYYFFAGNIHSDGLTESTAYDEDNLYSKLNYNISDKGKVLFTLGYNRGARGIIKIPQLDLSSDNTYKYVFSTFNFEHLINEETDFQFSFRWSKKDFDMINYKISTDLESHEITDDSSYGGSIDLTWKHGIHNLVFGFDLNQGKLKSKDITGGKQYIKKWAIFSNDTIMIDSVSLTPGIRYDHTNTDNDFVSPSLGLTYMFTKRNLIRGYIARGFHIPPLSSTYASSETSLKDNNKLVYEPNPDLKVEKIWSIQVGIESTVLRYLWFKSTLFQHNIKDLISISTWMTSDPNGITIHRKTINKNRQRRQGIELELKTVPLYNTSLSAGFTFIDAKDMDTDEKLIDVPINTYDIGIKYFDNKSFWVDIKGHYISWNAGPNHNCQDRTFIWDVNLMKNIHWDNEINIKTFFTMHNIFNTSQYYTDIYKNHGRWIETGLKFEF